MPKRLIVMGSLLLTALPAMSSPQIFTTPAIERIIDYNSVILNYRKNLSQDALTFSLISQENLNGVQLKHYRLRSQLWSPHGLVQPTEWIHNIDVYLPEKPRLRSALIVINNGTNYPVLKSAVTPPTDFPLNTLLNIAQSTRTAVISVSNIPNQYLSYDQTSEPIKEDDSVAQSWQIFLRNTVDNQRMSVHIPMAVATSQALRMAKQVLGPLGIKKFVVTGISKRGWSSWLATMSDPDIIAVVPFVFDLLNTKLALEHMYHTYGNNWPIAFRAYYQRDIDRKIDNESFRTLMLVEDPLQYKSKFFLKRLEVTKYIINSSGDDFYVPDNSHFYYGVLPGDKALRVVPNTDHYGIRDFSGQSLVAFLNRFQTYQTLPGVTETVRGGMLFVNFSETPVKIIRWTAKNAVARDFRFACKIRFTPTVIGFGKVNMVKVPLDNTPTGWEATFVEARFKDSFIATTQVYITPDNKYPHTAPPSVGPACQTLAGRGLGNF